MIVRKTPLRLLVLLEMFYVSSQSDITRDQGRGHLLVQDTL